MQDAESMVEPYCIISAEQTARGVFIRGTEPTKHYLREELVVLAREEMKLEALDVVRMEYDWKTEMEDETVPEWMGEPYPWDWILVERKN